MSQGANLATVLVAMLLGALALYGLFAFARRLQRNDMYLVLAANAITAMLLLGVGTTNWFIFLFVLLVINFLANVYIHSRHSRLLETLEEQLANALLIISGALKAGRSLEQGFGLVQRGMPSPISDEFGRVLQEQSLGMSFEDSLRNFMRRTPSKDYKLFLTATLFQRETGGNLIALYDQIIFAVSERRRLKGRIDNLTQQGRMTAYVMMLLPVLFLGFMFVASPGRFVSVLHMEGGVKLLLGSGLWMFLGLFWLWSIVTQKIG